MSCSITCDNCGMNSSDVIDYPITKMSELKNKLKELDWYITDHEQFCPECLILVLKDI